MSSSSRATAITVWAILISMVIAPGCGGKNGGGPTAPTVTTIPASWGGVWSVHTLVQACNPRVLVLDTTTVLTLCPGRPLDDLVRLAGVDSLCAGGRLTGTDRQVSFSCRRTVSRPECHATLTLSFVIDMDTAAGTFTGRGRLVQDAEPETIECFDYCVDITQTGTRTAPTPQNCTPAVAARLPRIRVASDQ